MFLLFKLVFEIVIHEAFVVHPSCVPEKSGHKLINLMEFIVLCP